MKTSNKLVTKKEQTHRYSGEKEAEEGKIE